MFRPLQLFLYLVLIIVLQVSILPACLEAPFNPNLMIILVCCLALRGGSPLTGAAVAYFAGLVIGSFSGFYFGLGGISCLIIYLCLNKVSDQLYTESTILLAVAVFLATLFDALVSMLLIMLFSSGSASYGTFLANMIPQASVTAFIAYLMFPRHTFLAGRLSR